MKATIMYRNSYHGGDGWTAYPMTVTLSDRCPVCSRRRGTPQPHTFHEDGEWLTVDRWENPCGHVDSYRACWHEARRLGRLRGFDAPATIIKVATYAERRGAQEFTFQQGRCTGRRPLPAAEWIELATKQRARLEDLAGRDVLELGGELAQELGEHSYFFLKPITVNDLLR